MCRLAHAAFVLIVLLLWVSVVSAAPVIVPFTGTDTVIAHGGIRANTLTLAGPDPYAAIYNALPVKTPFASSNPGAARLPTHPGVPTNQAFVNYSRLDGAGAFLFTQTGTTFGQPSGPGTSLPPGTRLPISAHTGLLPGPLALPNGSTIPAGSTIYSDFAGLVADFDDPASFWFDTTTGLEHRTYRNGTWSFFHEPTPGNFVKFAEYANVRETYLIDYVANAFTVTWTGDSVPIASILLPASGSTSSNEAINFSGFLTNEINVAGMSGWFGQFDGSLSISFDVDNAQMIPEPATLLTLSSLTLCLRRRNHGQLARPSNSHA